jgi:hypothetical protein
VLTPEKIKAVARIIMMADEVENSASLGTESFEDAVLQYASSLGVTREDVQQVMDTKLRELIQR